MLPCQEGREVQQARPCREGREVLPCQEASVEQRGVREEPVELPCRGVQGERPCRVALGAPVEGREGPEEQVGDRGVRVECFRRSCFFLLKSRKAATFAPLMST